MLQSYLEREQMLETRTECRDNYSDVRKPEVFFQNCQSRNSRRLKGTQ